MDSFTPADSECEDDNHHKNIRREITSPPNTTNDRPFTSIEVKSILNRMDSTKAPGENGITVDIFLRVFNIFPNTTTTIYNGCLERGCFPRIWKKSNIIPVIKPGKEDEENVEKFRPISLINIQAKVLEKLLINRIMFHMHSNNLLSNRQYGFTPQTSTVDALMLLKQHVQESITNKQCVVLISLDVKGAFDAAWWPSILKTLKDLKCPANLYNLSKSYLSERIATLSANNIAIQRSTSKGCPQGSCIGPGFWNLQYDSLLKLPYTKHTEVIAFADDFMMIIRGSNLTEIEHYANIEMLKVTNWAQQNKITFNDRKSKLLLITRKNQNSERGLTVYLNNRKLDQTKQMKYLGVTIDSKFSFNQHIEQITQKCTKLIHALAKSAKINWGLNYDVLKTIYSGAVLPLLSYAAPVWIDAARRSYNTAKLRRVQRLINIKMAKAFRSVSYEALCILTKTMPIITELEKLQNDTTLKNFNIKDFLWTQYSTTLNGRILQTQWKS